MKIKRSATRLSQIPKESKGKEKERSDSVDEVEERELVKAEGALARDAYDYNDAILACLLCKYEDFKDDNRDQEYEDDGMTKVSEVSEVSEMPTENLFDKSQKKKTIPLITAMKQKMKEKKEKKARKSKQTRIAEAAEDRHSFDDKDKAIQDATLAPATRPLVSYEQWESFMNTVAFPENSLAYKNLMEYMKHVTAQRDNSDNRPPETTILFEREDQEVEPADSYSSDSSSSGKSEEDDEINSTEFKFEGGSSLFGIKTKEQWVLFMNTVNSSKSHLTYENWSNFMDTVAFPERFVERKYRELKANEEGKQVNSVFDEPDATSTYYDSLDGSVAWSKNSILQNRVRQECAKPKPPQDDVTMKYYALHGDSVEWTQNSTLEKAQFKETKKVTKVGIVEDSQDWDESVSPHRMKLAQIDEINRNVSAGLPRNSLRLDE
jgi:hypothetical protein